MKNVFQSLLAVFSLLLSVDSYSQIPVYNSYPSAPATIYLDFDGQYVTGTSWNYNGPIAAGPSNLNNTQITEIFNRVAEDYRPFNVNITTDSNRYWSAPRFQRMRVIVTITSDWYGSAGGISQIGSFNWGDNTPCFVFSALLKYKTKSVAEAISHEAGHTLGLNHQSAYDANCAKTNEYNPGTGTGEIGWAPIMGYSYSRNLTLWHNGSNPYGCAEFQDDLAIITSRANGFGYRADDYSNEANAANSRNFSNNKFSASGVIEQINDKDVFKFTLPSPGNFHLDANPYSIGSIDNGSNLDLQIELLNSSQTVVGKYNPDLLLSATIDTALQPGDYYLKVGSVGNAYAPDYATLGSYSLTGTFTPSVVLPLHRLELHGTNESNRHKFDWIIDADETLTQQVLEVSTNGRSFQPVVPLSTTARTYAYVPNSSGILYYRLNVHFDNGKQYFSNVIALRNATNNQPSATSNLIYGSMEINSPSVFAYSIVDFNGRVIAKGNLEKGRNTIITSNFSNGMYIIQYSNGVEQYAEKFMKQ